MPTKILLKLILVFFIISKAITVLTKIPVLVQNYQHTFQYGSWELSDYFARQMFGVLTFGFLLDIAVLGVLIYLCTSRRILNKIVSWLNRE